MGEDNPKENLGNEEPSLEGESFNPEEDSPPIVDAIETVSDARNFLKWLFNDYNRKIKDLEEKIEDYGNQTHYALSIFEGLVEIFESLEKINKTLLEYMKRTANIPSANFNGENPNNFDNEFEGNITKYIRGDREVEGVIFGKPYTVVVKFDKPDYSGPVNVLFELDGPSELTLQVHSHADKGEINCKDAFILPKGYRLKDTNVIITNK